MLAYHIPLIYPFNISVGNLLCPKSDDCTMLDIMGYEKNKKKYNIFFTLLRSLYLIGDIEIRIQDDFHKNITNVKYTK